MTIPSKKCNSHRNESHLFDLIHYSLLGTNDFLSCHHYSWNNNQHWKRPELAKNHEKLKTFITYEAQKHSYIARSNWAFISSNEAFRFKFLTLILFPSIRKLFVGWTFSVVFAYISTPDTLPSTGTTCWFFPNSLQLLFC